MTRHFTPLILCAAVLFGLIPKPGSAQTTAELMTLQQRFNAGEHEEVLVVATPLAEAGVPRAMVILGVANLFGFGLPKNEPEGVRWITQAADAGSPRAMLILAEGLMYGWYGLDIDTDRALAYFERAAEMDNAMALTALSRYYSCSTCGKENDELAAVMGVRALQMIEPEAFSQLARLHNNGIGMPQDEAEARRLYQIAALLGEGDAANRWGHMAYSGFGGPKDIAEAMRAFVLGVKLEFARAGNNIAIVMFENPDLYPDRATALAWCMWSVREAKDEDRSEFTAHCKTETGASTPEVQAQAARLLPTLDPDTVR
jgi:TPR repeat protein